MWVRGLELDARGRGLLVVETWLNDSTATSRPRNYMKICKRTVPQAPRSPVWRGLDLNGKRDFVYSDSLFRAK